MKERWLPQGIKGTASAYEALIDMQMHALTGGAWKTLLYICRRTIGFGKQHDRISLSQICHGITTRAGRRLDCGTGLTRKSALHAVRELEDAGLIVRTAAQNPQPALFEVNWQRVAYDSQNSTGGESTPVLVEKIHHPLGEKVSIQQSGVQQTEQRAEIHDLDWLPTNRKNGDSRSVVDVACVYAQYPLVREALATYMLERPTDEKVYPSDRQVVDVVDEAGGASETEIIRCLHYHYNERGLRPGTRNGPRTFAWFPIVVGDYFQKKAIRDEGRTPIGYDEWSERNETRAANLAALELADPDEAAALLASGGAR